MLHNKNNTKDKESDRKSLSTYNNIGQKNNQSDVAEKSAIAAALETFKLSI
jgi:hypothetical protein